MTKIEVGTLKMAKELVEQQVMAMDAVKSTRGKHVYFEIGDELVARSCYGNGCNGKIKIITEFGGLAHGKGGKRSICTSCYSIQKQNSRATKSNRDEIIAGIGELGNVNGEPLQAFNFMGEMVRGTRIEGEPYLVAKDVTDILGYAESYYAVNRYLDNDEYLLADILTYNTENGKMQPVKSTFITESGVYGLIMESQKTEAKAFQRWLRKEVLPTIRRTGGYIAPDQDELFVDTYLGGKTIDPAARSIMIETVRQSRISQEQLTAATTHIEAIEPKAERYDEFLEADGTMTISAIASIHGMTANAMNKFLNEAGVIYKRGRTWYVSSRYVDKDIATMIPYVAPNGLTTMNLRWTSKGFDLIANLISERTA